MWTSLALVIGLGLANGQAEQLTISNVRASFGPLGPSRSNSKLLPGDLYHVSFDVDGFKVDEEGKLAYSMGMQVTNDKGRVAYGLEPQDQEALNILGGANQRIFTYFNAATHPPGEYTLKVTVSDRATKAHVTLTRKLEILPMAFGIVRLSTSYDSSNLNPAPPGGVVGQILWVHCAALGFERDKDKKQPDLYTEFRVLDEKGKPTLTKTLYGKINSGVEAAEVLVPMSFRLTLNRPGKFVAELQMTDKVARKTQKISFPLTVTDQKPSNEEQTGQ